VRIPDHGPWRFSKNRQKWRQCLTDACNCPVPACYPIFRKANNKRGFSQEEERHIGKDYFHCSKGQRSQFVRMRRSLLLHAVPFALGMFWLPCCSCFSVRMADQSNKPVRQSRQLLEFVEPTTGVTVQLVGAMHYNPASIDLATTTIRRLAENGTLGSVIIESCDIRWNSTMAIDNSVVNALLKSEMRAAHDLALKYQRPVILGDQRINVTVSKMKMGFAETLRDFATFRWKDWATVVGRARQEALPQGDQYLNAGDFLDPKLLLAAPVSLLKYPLSFVVKSPLSTLAFLSILLLLDGTISTASAVTGVGGFLGDYVAQPEPTIMDWVIDLGLSALETAFFARVFLKELLVERNAILARNILKQCRLQQEHQTSSRSFRSPWQKLMDSLSGSRSPHSNVGTDTLETVYAPENCVAEREGKGKVVVAVLGMAHCNGIMRLLTEQRVSVN